MKRDTKQALSLALFISSPRRSEEGSSGYSKCPHGSHGECPHGLAVGVQAGLVGEQGPADVGVLEAVEQLLDLIQEVFEEGGVEVLLFIAP